MKFAFRLGILEFLQQETQALDRKLVVLTAASGTTNALILAVVNAAVASIPSGGRSAVTAWDGQAAKSRNPRACAPARVARARPAWRRCTASSPSSRIIASDSSSASTRLTGGVKAVSPSGALFRAFRRSK
jgi:hypothetical protein